MTDEISRPRARDYRVDLGKKGFERATIDTIEKICEEQRAMGHAIKDMADQLTHMTKLMAMIVQVADNMKEITDTANMMMGAPEDKHPPSSHAEHARRHGAADIRQHQANRHRHMPDMGRYALRPSQDGC